MMKLNVLTIAAYLSCAGMPYFYALSLNTAQGLTYARFKEKSKLIEAINATVAEQFTEELLAACCPDRISDGILTR